MKSRPHWRSTTDSSGAQFVFAAESGRASVRLFSLGGGRSEKWTVGRSLGLPGAEDDGGDGAKGGVDDLTLSSGTFFKHVGGRELGFGGRRRDVFEHGLSLIMDPRPPSFVVEQSSSSTVAWNGLDLGIQSRASPSSELGVDGPSLGVDGSDASVESQLELTVGPVSMTSRQR